MFSQPISLTFNQMTSFSTKKGLMMTFCVIGLSMTAVYYFGKQVFQKNNPNVVKNQRNINDPPIFKMTPHSLPFAFGLLTYEDWNYIEEDTIYLPEIIYTKTYYQTDEEGFEIQ